MCLLSSFRKGRPTDFYRMYLYTSSPDEPIRVAILRIRGSTRTSRIAAATIQGPSKPSRRWCPSDPEGEVGIVPPTAGRSSLPTSFLTRSIAWGCLPLISTESKHASLSRILLRRSCQGVERVRLTDPLDDLVYRSIATSGHDGRDASGSVASDPDRVTGSSVSSSENPRLRHDRYLCRRVPAGARWILDYQGLAWFVPPKWQVTDRRFSR